MPTIFFVAPLVAALALLLGAPLVAAARPAPTSWIVGDPVDALATAQGGAMLAGGGADVDAALAFLASRAAGGDVVVLRTSGADGYNDYIASLGNVDSVETLLFQRRGAAFDEGAAKRIADAEAIFFAGGDQKDYVRFWKETPVEDAVHQAVARGAVVGGTSAGLAILGDIVFPARRGTVTSTEALEAPCSGRTRLVDDFLGLPFFDNVLTDSHFAERDRMGRLVAFLARAAFDGLVDVPLGLGIDEETALLVDDSGAATVVGQGRVYALTGPVPVASCPRSGGLDVNGVLVESLGAGDSFDLPSWQGSGDAWSLRVDDGALSSDRPGGDIY